MATRADHEERHRASERGQLETLFLTRADSQRCWYATAMLRVRVGLTIVYS